MGSPPTRLEVASLLVSFHAIPTRMVRPIVSAEGFNDVRRLSITPFAAVGLVVFAWDHFLVGDSIIIEAATVVAQNPASPAMFNASNLIGWE